MLYAAPVVVSNDWPAADEVLEERISQTGTDYSMLEMAWGTLGHEAEMRSLQLFASDVMPHFK